jgi:hypothetical protein
MAIITHLWDLATQKQRKSLYVNTVHFLHHLQALLHIRLVRCRDVVGTQSEDQPAKLEEVILLEQRDVLLRGAKEEDVENATRADTYTVGVKNETRKNKIRRKRTDSGLLPTPLIHQSS